MCYYCAISLDIEKKCCICRDIPVKVWCSYCVQEWWNLIDDDTPRSKIRKVRRRQNILHKYEQLPSWKAGYNLGYVKNFLSKKFKDFDNINATDLLFYQTQPGVRRSVLKKRGDDSGL